MTHIVTTDSTNTAPCTTSPRIPTRDFTVMGGRGHIVIYGGDEHLVDQGEARLRELESKWSRFLPDSDITRANRAAGMPVEVSADTITVVQRALDGWRQTDGRFDITMLPALVESGTRTARCHRWPPPSCPGASWACRGW